MKEDTIIINNKMNHQTAGISERSKFLEGEGKKRKEKIK
jgi:hypothetical protein